LADELKDQRVVTMMSPSELEAIDEWMFRNRLKSRGEAIRRLCHLGMTAEKREGELLKVIMDGLDKEQEMVRRMGSKDTELSHIEVFDVGQAFLREVYALAGTAMMESMVLRTAPTSKEGIDTAKEIAKRLKALGSSQKQINTFVNFASGLKESRERKKDKRSGENA
jgi:hypothetical protein